MWTNIRGRPPSTKIVVCLLINFTWQAHGLALLASLQCSPRPGSQRDRECAPGQVSMNLGDASVDSEPEIRGLHSL